MLRALGNPPFEPLAQASLRILSLKTALLLALTSAKRMSDLCALSVSPSCLSIRGGGSRSAATLQPNPSFTPKVLTSSFRSRVFSLEGFFPSRQQRRGSFSPSVSGVRVITVCFTHGRHQANTAAVCTLYGTLKRRGTFKTASVSLAAQGYHPGL